MHPSPEDVCRRTFLSRAGVGLGACALSGLLARDGLAAALEGNARRLPERFAGAVDPLHHVPRAKAVIFLCMAGGPTGRICPRA